MTLAIFLVLVSMEEGHDTSATYQQRQKHMIQLAVHRRSVSANMVHKLNIRLEGLLFVVSFLSHTSRLHHSANVQ